MDNAAFDGLARQIAGRRGILKMLVGMAAAGPAAAVAASAQAGGQRCGKPAAGCSKKKKCCDGLTCKKGLCVCPGGTAACDRNGRCQDLATSRRHCGACGNACDANSTCTNGVCCTPGNATCDGACCKTGEVCVAANGDDPAGCCPADLAFVLCPKEYIVVDLATQSSYCDMSAAAIADLPETCCPADAVCPNDGLCCIDPDTNAAVACNANGSCDLYPVEAATYTPPVKGRN